MSRDDPPAIRNIKNSGVSPERRSEMSACCPRDGIGTIHTLLVRVDMDPYIYGIIGKNIKTETYV